MDGLKAIFSRPSNPLDSGTIPGTRKVNNLPIILGVAVLVLFLTIIGLVISNRAQQSMEKKEETKTSSSAMQIATELTAPWESGFVPSKEDRKEDAPETPAPEQPRTETETLQLPAAKDFPQIPTPALPAPDPWGEARERFRTQRLQAYETALKSRTGLQIGRRDAGSATDAGKIREQLQATQQQIARMNGDPESLLQARLGALSQPSGTSATSQSAPQFSRDNNWTLPHTLEEPAAFTLQAGFVIPAIMISGITSNLPGQVMAQVSQNVYDTPTGQYLLVPQGTRLVGTYGSDVAYGQERVLMAWQRLLFPDGRTLDIQAMPGADNAGNAGFSDEINNHYFRTFSSAFLLSGVIAAVSMSQDSGEDSGNQQRASDALSESLGQTLGTTMAEMIRKNLNIAPTLHIRPGYRFNIMVTKDINFPGAYSAK